MAARSKKEVLIALPKPPRAYAFAYLAAKTPGEQRQAVSGCPVEWRDLVRTHIRLIKEKQEIK